MGTRVNPERDYIKVGTCGKCKREQMSVVVHHPRNSRPYAICHYCSKDTWHAVGESNKENYLKWGEVTKPRPDRYRNDRRRHGGRNTGDHRDRNTGERNDRNAGDNRDRKFYRNNKNDS